MQKAKPVGIQEKPEVDLELLDKLADEEGNKVDKIIKKAEKDEDEDIVPEKEIEEPKEAKKTEIDYETKYKESQKEALVLKSQLEQMEAEKNKKIEVTDEYLKEKYPDWDDLTTGEQKAIRKSEILEQEVLEIKNNANMFNNDRKWQEKVDNYVESDLPDQFPKIVGREDEFRRFATRPSRKGLPLDDLAKIFLFENPAPEPKRSLFHGGNSGGNQPATDEGMSAEEIRLLRVSRPTEYMRLIRAGKIKIKI